MAKGQAAMEFLMTYGWAILVVLIAIGALAYFGVLNPARFLPSSCTIAPGIGCDDFLLEADGDLTLILRNGIGDDLTAVDVAVETCTDSAEADGNDAWNDGTILGTDNIKLTGCTVGAVNSKFKADITVTYTGSSGLTHTKVGQIVTKVEAAVI